MNQGFLRLLRLSGYAPATLLDVGTADAGIAPLVLAEFPECGVTHLHQGADGVASGIAPQIDAAFPGQQFDLVHLDAPEFELSALDAAVTTLAHADYVALRLPALHRAALLAAANGRLRNIGLRLAEIWGPTPAAGATARHCVLFERVSPRQSQAFRYTPVFAHRDTLAYLKLRKAREPGFTVLDVGAAMQPWTAEVLDATFDMNPVSVGGLHFRGNINRIEDWAPILEHVGRHGKFSYSVCSHTLEDLAYPRLALEMLPRVSEAGYLAFPSRFWELLRREGPYRGFIHHRWIMCRNGTELLLLPKVSYIDHIAFPEEQAWAKDPSRWELQLHWRGGIRFAVLNDDFLGPTGAAVQALYRSTLLGRPA